MSRKKIIDIQEKKTIFTCTINIQVKKISR